jgi:hypothetical protein
VDLKKPVKIVPFSFIPDGKKNSKKGINLYQNDIKVESFYYDTDTKENINGYPKPKKGGKLTKSEWRKYFSEAGEFLVEDTIKRFKIEEETKGEDF